MSNLLLDMSVIPKNSIEKKKWSLFKRGLGIACPKNHPAFSFKPPAFIHLAPQKGQSLFVSSLPIFIDMHEARRTLFAPQLLATPSAIIFHQGTQVASKMKIFQNNPDFRGFSDWLFMPPSR